MAQASFDSTAPRGMGAAGLSGGFYAVAYEITSSMMKRGLHEGGSYRYTASVIILLQACLEAYINEFLYIQRKFPSQPIEHKFAQLKIHNRSSIRDKWRKAPLLFGDQTFDEGAEPFQSFSLLVTLRNTIGHYEPKFRTPTEFPTAEFERLKTKFEFSYPDTANWTSQVLNLECARWGCRTAKALIPKLHEFAGGIDFSSVGRPWPEPP